MHARLISPLELGVGEIGLWRDFQRARPELASPFFSPEFACAIADARSDACVAVLRRDQRIVGFLPFHRLRGGVAKPIGGPISDYQGPILAPDVTIDVESLLGACRLTSYDFNHLPMAIAPLASGRLQTATSPWIDVSGGFQAYVAARPPSGRHAIKDVQRCQRKIASEIGPVRFEMHDPSERAWEWLVATKSVAYRRLGVPVAFDVPWVARALAAIRSRQGREFRAALSTVYAGDRLIAANFGMRTATDLCWWFTTYDPAVRDRGPGLILLLSAAERGACDGLRMIDFGRGDEPYKRKFASGETELCEGSIELSRSVAGLMRRAQKLVVRSIAHVPLGRFQSWPRRLFARVLTGVRLPA
jgi:CelD/BcsL family acetyltransferase involved in cellulose biosynthesis